MPIRPENKHRYPKNWKEIREKILERSGNKCEWKDCGVANYSMVQRVSGGSVRTIKIVLTIAHLDHIPENCDPSNLMALCQRHHNRYDAPMRVAGRKLRNK